MQIYSSVELKYWGSMSTEFRKALSFIDTEVRDEHHELECNVTLTPHEFSELTYEVGYSAPPEITGLYIFVDICYWSF
jgi:hypothetical protein